jgi:hypothetical protein
MWMPAFMDRTVLDVRSPLALRLLGFTVGAPAPGAIYVARKDCRVNAMRIPPGARALGTGAPVRNVALSLRSWSRVLLWRLTLRV